MRRVFTLAMILLASAGCDNRSPAEKEYDEAMKNFSAETKAITDTAERQIGAVNRGDTQVISCLDKAQTKVERRAC